MGNVPSQELVFIDFKIATSKVVRSVTFFRPAVIKQFSQPLTLSIKTEKMLVAQNIG